MDSYPLPNITHLQKEKYQTSSFKSLVIYSFAIFAMFFGSGNLVFPLQIGVAAGTNWIWSLLGLGITGILLPFLGLFVIKLYKGNYYNFFAEAGLCTKLLLPFFILSLLGSFGVVPRCITVAYGGISVLCPEITLAQFSAIFCVITYVLCLKDKAMVKAIGKWMTPILLLALIMLIVIGIFYSPSITQKIPKEEALMKGLLTGYQTMDLLAAFFFSSFIFTQIKEGIPQLKGDKAVAQFAIKSSLIGALLLILIYAGFVFLGARYSFLVANIAPELFLPTIAQYTMGNNATLLVCIAITFSCLTTAIALNNIYAKHLCGILRLQLAKFPWILLITTAISFVVSLQDFSGIAKILVPILTIAYPAIIALTLLCIFTNTNKTFKTVIFYLITFFMIYKVIAT